MEDPSEDSDGGQSSTSSNNGTTGPLGRRSESVDEPQRPTAAGTTTSFPKAADVAVAAAASIGDNDLHNLNDRLPSSTGKVLKPIAQRAQPFPRAQPQTNMESLFPRSFLPYHYYPPQNTIMVPTQQVEMAEWLRRQTSTQENPDRILNRAPHYPPAAPYGVVSGGGGLLRTHSFVPPKVSQSPPTTPPISLPPDVTFRPVSVTAPRTLAISSATSLSLTSSTSSSSAIVNNSALSASVATTATAVSGHKRARKPKDDDLIPEFSRGELTRNDIVESNIEDFNNKCADKPEEQRTILKDKRRKGKNRVSTEQGFFPHETFNTDFPSVYLHYTSLSPPTFDCNDKTTPTSLNNFWEKLT